ncbi:MAG TPA: methyltransferase domain-containing protein [Vicinamibacterales bacterium]|nr:methyltransferase domain-containing protein [Vicinamibacterales bacterium]
MKRALFVLAMLSLPAHPAHPAPPALSGPDQQKANTRLFGTQDLGLLEAPDREQWQKPDQIMDAIGVAEGSKVAELGAAGGWFTLQLAERVGPNGRVYAEDIQRAMLEGISRRMQSENLTNVTTVLGTPSDPHLPPGLDAALISDAFHEMDDPDDPKLVVTLLRNVGQSLKPQGRLGIVDWTPGSGGPGPEANHRVDPKTVIKAANAAGLELIKREDFPPFVFLLVFGRASGLSSTGPPTP